MNNAEDREFENEAISALDKFLCDYSIPKSVECLDVTIKEITDIYVSSRDLVRRNLKEVEFNQTANTVFRVCIRVVRCLLLDNVNAKITIINGREYKLIASQQIETMRKEYKNMIEMAKKY